MKRGRPSRIRACVDCHWLFRGGYECPMCGAGSHLARFIYGDRTYNYARNQEPWRQQQRDRLEETMAQIVAHHKRIRQDQTT